MKKILMACLAALLVCGTAFALNAREFQKTDFMMDTVVRIRAHGWRSRAAVEAALERVRQVEQQTSAYLSDSQIGRLNRDGTATLSGDALACMRIAAEVWEKSYGAFDPTVKPLVDLWNIKDGTGYLPDSAELDEARSLVGMEQVTFDPDTGYVSLVPGAGLDLGGVAKGYAADVARDTLAQYGIKQAIIDLGGNIYVMGDNRGDGWKVGLRDPDGEQGSYFGTVQVSDRAVVTSGGYERFFTHDGTDYHHILDPYTGQPAATGLKSVTIVTSSSAYADALATAVYVLGEERALPVLEDMPDIEAVVVRNDGTVYVTAGAGFISSY